MLGNLRITVRTFVFFLMVNTIPIDKTKTIDFIIVNGAARKLFDFNRPLPILFFKSHEEKAVVQMRKTISSDYRIDGFFY